MAKKILVIDDEFAIAQLLKINLEDAGYSVDMALSGAEALEKAKEIIPDIITLDVLMPEMNGFQVLEILKKDPKTKDIPVILVSIVAGPQVQRGFHLGAVDFIPKPVEFEKLCTSIENVEKKLLETPGVTLKKQILVVDDEKDTAKLIKISLEDRGFRTLVAYNGPDAIEITKKEQPDLVLLDLNMPEMNGFAVMKILKSDPRTDHIPIVVLTGYDTKGWKERCLMLGASEYLTKPFSDQVLLNEVQKHLERIIS